MSDLLAASDLGYEGRLSSFADDNAEMFARILTVYGRPGMTVVDPTFGKGVFWKKADMGAYDVHATDLEADGVDLRALPYQDGSAHMVVLDPPYRYVAKKSTVWKSMDEPYNITGTIGKDQSFNRISDVVALYTDGMTEAARVLMGGGYLVVKCQDTGGDGGQTWVHIDLMAHAAAIGCEVIDLAVIGNDNPPPSRWKIQRSLKKAHSYFIVARKGGRWPFGYQSVQRRQIVPIEGDTP